MQKKSVRFFLFVVLTWRKRAEMFPAARLSSKHGKAILKYKVKKIVLHKMRTLRLKVVLISVILQKTFNSMNTWTCIYCEA